MESETHDRTGRFKCIFAVAATLMALVLLWLHSDRASYAQTASPAVLKAPELTAEGRDDAIELTWSAVPGAARYELWAWWDSDIDWFQLDDGELTGTTYLHTELLSGTTYYYLVRAVSEMGEAGAWSERVSATYTVGQSRIAQPVLSVSADEGLVELSWTPVNGAVRYELWAWTSWEGWQRLDEGTLVNTKFSHMGLPAGMTYVYVVRAIGESGEKSEWAVQVSATVPGYLVVPEVPEEKAALVALFEATGGANWRRSEHWLSGLSIANWYGVHTDQEGHVTGLFLENNGLIGPIPDLSSLTSLTSLNLGINRLSGPIPELSELDGLTHLSLQQNQLNGSVPDLNSLINLRHLDLGNNELTGPIPDLNNQTGLNSLYLNNNRLSGPIPDLSAVTGLQRLDLGSNQLTGPVPELCSLTNLTHVYLGFNQLTGTIPELCDLPHLQALYLSNNKLTGPIPDLNALTSLEILYLSDNGLSGSIPDLGALTNLWRLSLGSNELTGPIPELEGLTRLTQLFLESNLLNGPIPDLGGLPRLTDLNLSNNSLEGPVPALGALTKLTTLRLNSNGLTGAIPVLGALSFVIDLDLSNNSLTGEIPELSDLFRLETLDLSGNGLGGPFPNLYELKRLIGVSLRDNRLTGPIPDLSALTNLRWLALGTNQFSGQVPDLSLLANLRILDLSDNQFSGPAVGLGALKELTQVSLGRNRLAGPLPDIAGLSKLVSLEITGNQYCLSPSSGGQGSNEIVSAHLDSLSLATCTEAELATARTAPSNLKGTAGDGMVELEWDATAGAVSYDLREWDSIERTWSPAGKSLTDTQFTRDVLTDGRNYRFQVRAKDADGVRGPWSKQLLVTVVDQQFPPPPVTLDLEPFFQKHLDIGGFVVVAPSEVNDEKVVQAGEIISGVLSKRADLLETLAANDARIEFFGYWREVAGDSDRWVADVTQHDPNCGDFLQEFASLIRLALEEQADRDEFRSRLKNAYQAAVEAGLWKGRLASTGVAGYWAETVMYWFRETLPPSLAGNYLTLGDYDPQAASLIEEVFGEASAPSVCKS